MLTLIKIEWKEWEMTEWENEIYVNIYIYIKFIRLRDKIQLKADLNNCRKVKQ